MLAWLLLVATVACGADEGASPDGQPPVEPPGAATPNVIVDPLQTFQTISGWEVTLARDWTWSPALRDAIVEAAVNDLGINRVRAEAVGGDRHGNDAIESGDGKVAKNDDDDPSVLNPAGFKWGVFDQGIVEWVLPMKRLVEGRGEPFVLNVCYVGFHSTTEFQKQPAEYAELVSAVLQRLRSSFGLEPEIWEVSLEPDNPVRKSGSELGEMTKAAGDRARAEGFHKVMFAGPSVTDADHAPERLSGMLGVPGTGPYLAEAVYHRYRGDPSEATLEQIKLTARAAGLRTAMLELIGADHEMLYEDLTVAEVSAWQQFSLAFPAPRDRGGTLYVVRGDDFSLSSSGWFLRQYFRYIRPGAVRVGVVSTDSDRIRPVAFRNPSGDIVVVANTEGQADLAIAGLPPGAYQVSYTTAALRGASGTPVTIGPGEVLETAIPAAGVITVAP